jgi:hypothetical protein
VPREGMVKGIESLANQTYKDFDLIICHDGPKKIPYEDEINFAELGLSPHLINTEVRMNDWGHSSRDLAMRYAYENLPECDYYIQFNIDNYFESNAFETINTFIKNFPVGIVIFSVRHWKAVGGSTFSGIPPILYNIDAMQLVAHKDIWESSGFWSDKSETSDGVIYENLCKQNKFYIINECLGDNY